MGGPVYELRQDTLHPGSRETLVRLFDEHFVEGQEEHGIQVIGQFRDLGRPDHFVWIRGFDNVEARTTALEGFYSGAAWKAQGRRASAVMAGPGEVRLLRPAYPGSGFEHDPEIRPRRSHPERRGEGGFVVAHLHVFARSLEDNFCARFRAEVAPALAVTGTPPLAELVTESAPNSFPRLPVREGEHVFVWLVAYPDRATERASARMLSRILPGLRSLSPSEPERLLLGPTRR
ncbi:MAG TPA: NIPSNAP family protein, partial [Vicinamibacteria bacterium]